LLRDRADRGDVEARRHPIRSHPSIDQASREFVERDAPDDQASQLKVLADLHDRGKLTDDEFSAEKARLTGAPQPAGAAS
jgi:hypothetical protein